LLYVRLTTKCAESKRELDLLPQEMMAHLKFWQCLLAKQQLLEQALEAADHKSRDRELETATVG